ncbi:hypothetical protein D046_4420 [Vibrio parahaemolyticus V-223/04]|nr:hypothetical protein D046_4420 [Vibrio parahaemolyticus V-223/04]
MRIRRDTQMGEVRLTSQSLNRFSWSEEEGRAVESSDQSAV